MLLDIKGKSRCRGIYVKKKVFYQVLWITTVHKVIISPHLCILSIFCVRLKKMIDKYGLIIVSEDKISQLLEKQNENN